MRRIRFTICDVFTDRPLAGNQLAVFSGGEGLDGGTMQALAREMNFSESVFLLRAQAGGHARVRIFTPAHELPFAGHPVLGAAFVIGDSVHLETLRIETGKGVVPVRLRREGPRPVFGWMEQPLPAVAPFEREPELLAALGVPASDLPIEVYDNGPRHVYVALRDREAVARLRPDFVRLAAALGPVGVSVFAGEGSAYKTRVLDPGLGVNEDPATGSAAGPLALHLARHGRIRFGDEIRIEQGAEIGRPSVLFARVEGEAGRVDRVEVGGAAVLIGRGEIRLP